MGARGWLQVLVIEHFYQLSHLLSATRIIVCVCVCVLLCIRTHVYECLHIHVNKCRCTHPIICRSQRTTLCINPCLLPSVSQWYRSESDKGHQMTFSASVYMCRHIHMHTTYTYPPMSHTCRHTPWKRWQRPVLRECSWGHALENRPISTAYSVPFLHESFSRKQTAAYTLDKNQTTTFPVPTGLWLLEGNCVLHVCFTGVQVLKNAAVTNP